jgi:phage tail-like protein
MRRSGGRGLVGTAEGGWYDSGDRWVPLVAQRRISYAASATLETGPLDSGEVRCRWHRLLFDGQVPAGSAVRVWSAASDDAASLTEAPDWQPEPTPYRRGDGSELPYAAVPRDPRSGTWELLLQAAQGRYLRVRLELSGDGRSTPRIRALRVHHPRFSYLEHYLPGVYRQDAGSAAFLDGFLANLEGTWTTIEGRIAGAQVLLDATTAPSEALDWLASWLGVVLDPAWDDERRRLFIRHATDLFRWRGTHRGLRLALSLALLDCPAERATAIASEHEPGGIRIVESFQVRRSAALPGASGEEDASLPRVGDPGPRWTPADGGAALHARYAAWLARVAAGDRIRIRPSGLDTLVGWGGAGGITSPSDAIRGLAGFRPDPFAALRPSAPARYPIVEPTDATTAGWRAFSDAVLGFRPAADRLGRARWSAFLARRYPRVDAFNVAWRQVGAASLARFEDAHPPTELPPDGPPLADWHAYETVVVKGVQAAHRFSVLLPVPVGRVAGGVTRATDARERAAEDARVARLVDLEKPAHTVYDIRSVWQAFRVGEARLGRDTLLDLGGRAPELRPPAVLGSMQVGEGVLTSLTADVPPRPDPFSATGRAPRRTHG